MKSRTLRRLFGAACFLLPWIATGSFAADPISVEDANVIICGEDAYDESGFWSSGAGDVNQDGFEDVLIGAPFAKGGGCAYLVYGGGDDLPPEIDLADPPADRVVKIIPAKYDKRLGASVVGLGDFNDDGYPDFAVSAHQSKFEGRWKAGKVYVIYGSDSLPAEIDLENLTGTEGLVIGGDDSYDELAEVISSAGDFNDDGIPDLLMGARWGNHDRGAAYLLYGSASHPAVIDLDDGLAGIGVVFNGANYGDQAGYANDGIGDFNCDDIDDIIITAEHADPNGSKSGLAYIIYGSDGAPDVVELDDLAASGLDYTIIEGGFAGDELGHSAAGAGDVNNDGNPDVIIGADQAERNGLDRAGEVYVIYGCNDDLPQIVVATDLTSDQGFTLQGIAYGDEFGTAVDGIGDVNADHIDDIIIGAEGGNPGGQINAGIVYVIYGGQDFPDLITGADFSVYGQVYNGANPGDQAGQSVRLAGDVNGDGSLDFIIGAEHADREPACCCSGKVTELRLLYTGPDGYVEVLQNKNNDVLYEGDIVDGEEISFMGTKSGNNMGSSISVYIDGAEHYLNTSCSEDIYIGMTFGPFEITYGESRYNGTLCDSPSTLITIGGNDDDDDGGSTTFDSCKPQGKKAGKNYIFFGDPTPPPTDLVCAAEGTAVTLTWTNPAEYDEILVYQNGVLLATLAGDATSYDVARAPAGTNTYELAGVKNGYETERTKCIINVVVLPVIDLECSSSGVAVNLTWTNGQSYSTGIEIYRNGDLIATLPGTATSFNDMPLPEPGMYTYAVRGINGGDASTDTYCDVEIPEPVVDLLCDVDGHDVTLSWINGQNDYDEIQIKRDGVVIVTLAGDATTFTELGVPAGEHTYSVSAIIDGNFSIAVECDVVVVPPVEDLMCRGEGFDAILEWTNAATYDTIRILRNGTEIAVLRGTDTTYTDAGLLPGEYTYEVIAEIGTGQSKPVECEVTILIPIKDFVCCAIGDDVFLSWTNGQIYGSIEVYRDGVLIDTLGGNDNNYTDLDLLAGDYTYELIAKDDGTVADPMSCDITVLDPPFDLICTSTGSTVTLDWLNGSVYESIEVRRNGSLVATLGGTETTYVDAVSPGTYIYEVTGFASAGKSISLSAMCEVVDPGAPFGLECSALDDTVTVNWNNGDVYEEVKIFLDGVLEQSLDGDATTTTLTLTPGTYEICVVGVIAGNDSSPACCNVTVLEPITDLECSAVGDVVTLTWTNGETYETIEIVRDGVVIDTIPGSLEIYVDSGVPAGDHTYEITPTIDGGTTSPVSCDVRVLEPIVDLECTADSGTVMITFTGGEIYDSIEVRRNGLLVATLGGAATSYTDMGLSPGEYTYTLVGFLGMSVTAEVECVVRVPLPPTDLVCSLTDGKDVSLNWTNGELGDEILVFRNGIEIASLAGSTSTFSEGDLDPGTYEYCLVNVIDGNLSTPTCCTITVPDPIVDVLCVAVAGGVQLDWTNGETYDSVIILRNGVFVAAIPGDQETFFDPDVPAGAYTYTLIGFLDGFDSQEASCMVTVPNPVEDLECTLNFTSVEITWTLPQMYDSIQVIRNGTVIATLAGTATSYIDAAISPGTYTYEVIGLVGDDAAAAATCVVEVPQAINDLDCCADGTTVELTWSNPKTYDEFEIIRNGTLIATIGGAATSFTDSGVGVGDVNYVIFGVVGGASSLPAACSTRVLDPITEIDCMVGTPDCVNEDVTITWTNNDSYDSIEILRDGALLATVPGNSTSFLDTTAFATHDYTLVALLTGDECSQVTTLGCQNVEAAQGEFLRGDTNNDGIVNIADPVYAIKYIFLNAVPRPVCEDAADANDDGQFDIADAVFQVRYLFQGGAEPPAPFPGIGKDNTCDQLRCDL